MNTDFQPSKITIIAVIPLYYSLFFTWCPTLCPYAYIQAQSAVVFVFNYRLLLFLLFSYCRLLNNRFWCFLWNFTWLPLLMSLLWLRLFLFFHLRSRVCRIDTFVIDINTLTAYLNFWIFYLYFFLFLFLVGLQMTQVGIFHRYGWI